jgi:hypothetical protein
MSQPSEFSEGGNPIYRHEKREKPFEMVFGDANHIQLIESHIEKYIGKPDWVFHELVSDLVHIDVHVINPKPERNFYTLITTGMSARSMKAPEGHEELAYAELMICLPPDWKLSQKDFEDENNYWPIRLLKMLARLPHEYDTWLSFAHTIPNGDPAIPYAPNTRFCCALLAPPVTVTEDFWKFKVTPELTLHIYAILPLYAEEVALKLKKGADALFNRFDAQGLNEVVNLNRKNAGKKLFGLF